MHDQAPKPEPVHPDQRASAASSQPSVPFSHARSDASDPPARESEAAFIWLFEELRTLARAQISSERVGHTLSATALVNEVYLKLRGGLHGPAELRSTDAEARARFFSLAARAMRQILIDHARTRTRTKRGGDQRRIDLALVDPPSLAPNEPAIDASEIATLLARLELEHPDAARVVELRFFAGLTEVAIADILGITERTVRRHWTFAKAWLHRELSRDTFETS